MPGGMAWAMEHTRCCLAETDKIMSVNDLIEVTDIPRPFLRKIMQVLNKKGVIESQKGFHGGFKLISDPRGISIMRLITALQGDVSIMEHVFKKERCPNTESCRLKKKIDVIEDELFQKLNAITIQDIIDT